MIYNPNDPRDYLDIVKKVGKAKELGRKLDIKFHVPARTNKQNSYLHLILSYFASQYGCTLTEAKETFFKRIANQELFLTASVNKYGKEITTYRSTADLSTAEMSSAINNFKDWCAIETDGLLILPDADDYHAIRHCQQEIEKVQSYI